MSLKDRIRVKRLESETDRALAMQVLKATYRQEKNWVADEEKMFSAEDMLNENVSWFVAYDEDKPVGVLRILYSPPLELYAAYGFKKIDDNLDVDHFVKNHKIAEIGRFAVLPEYRKFINVSIALMNNASKETVERGFSHYITDVFEGEQHSPYDFHTRVMGFMPVATHDVGELNCPNRRITLVLDIKQAYNHLRRNKKGVFRRITESWDQSLRDQLTDD